MHADLLLGAGLVLTALAVTGLVFLRFRQSVVPAFILLGVALRREHFDAELVDAVALIGVVLLLFSIGLEFSLGALVRNRHRITRTGTIDLLVCLPLGIVAGLAVGDGWVGALLLGGAFYVTSSAIVAKSVIELRRAADPETEIALGILVFEDLFIALYLAVLSGAILASEPSLGAAAAGVAKALLFLGVLVLIAVRARPFLERAFSVESDELFVLLAGGLVLLTAWAALAAGLSEAIGAFVAGLALAETRQRERAERLFAPLQNVFAALFFFGFGLSIDPRTFGDVWLPALALALLGVVAKLTAGWIAGRREGLGRRGALALGLMLTPRGEFSIVLAGIALAVGRNRLGALLALLVLALSLIGTVTLRYAPQIGGWAFLPQKLREKPPET